MTHRDKKLILIPHRIVGNIYVRELGRAFQDLGHTVLFGPENLFESAIKPDVIHLHWPEEQYRAYGEAKIELRANSFITQLDKRIADGTKLAWTVHNLNPHLVLNKTIETRVYQAVIDRVQVIHHHCVNSQKLLEKRYRVQSNTNQVVAPHGHYFAYSNTFSKAEARTQLTLPKDAFVFLQFGAIRNFESFRNLRTAFLRANVTNKHLLVAGRIEATRSLMQRIQSLSDRKTKRHMTLHHGHVKNDEVQLYLNACDVVVLSHLSGLNSGIVVLAMSFGKPTIGPDIGCIGEVLREGENIIVSKGSSSELVDAMERSTSLDLARIAVQNKRIANEWQWSRICDAVINALAD